MCSFSHHFACVFYYMPSQFDYKIGVYSLESRCSSVVAHNCLKAKKSAAQRWIALIWCDEMNNVVLLSDYSILERLGKTIWDVLWNLSFLFKIYLFKLLLTCNKWYSPINNYIITNAITRTGYIPFKTVTDFTFTLE